MLSPSRLAHITNLMLWDIEFDDDCMALFVSGFSIQQPCHIEKLNFSNNRIGPRGAESLARLLHTKNSSVKCLNLYRNCLGDDGTYWLSTVLSNLDALNLDHNSVGDRGLQFINVKLKNSSIQSLSLCYNNITSISASALISITKTLTSIFLTSNSIDPSFLIRLKQKIQRLSSTWALGHLALSYNYISQRDIDQLSLPATIKNSRLCSLTLDHHIQTKQGELPSYPESIVNPLHRVSNELIQKATELNPYQLSVYPPLEKLVILTTTINNHLAKQTILYLHEVMICGAQFHHRLIAPILIPCEMRAVIQSKHFCKVFWVKLVHDLPHNHPYIQSLKQIMFLLRECHRECGFSKEQEICFFNSFRFHPVNILKPIEL